MVVSPNLHSILSPFETLEMVSCIAARRAYQQSSSSSKLTALLVSCRCINFILISFAVGVVVDAVVVVVAAAVLIFVVVIVIIVASARRLLGQYTE